MLRVITAKDTISKEKLNSTYYLFTKYNGFLVMLSQFDYQKSNFELISLPSGVRYGGELKSIQQAVDYINVYMRSEIYVTTDFDEARKYIKDNI